MKIVYMGTPEIAQHVLESIMQTGKHEIVLCVTQPDRPKGRGKSMAISDVKRLALDNGIPVYQPERIREPECVEELKKYDADIIVVTAFGQILPKEILELYRYGAINVHASLLPAYRGASPIQWAILNGEKTTGITIMQMDEGLDTGDILYQDEINIAPDETAGVLHDRLSMLGGECIVKALDMIADGTVNPRPQGEATTGYAGMLSKKMGRLDFTKPAKELDRIIRAYNPWPSAYAYLDGKMIKIWDVMVTGNVDSDCKPGDVYGIDKMGFYIATGKGGLRVLSLQPEGKRQMSAGEFQRGYMLYGKHFE